MNRKINFYLVLIFIINLFSCCENQNVEKKLNEFKKQINNDQREVSFVIDYQDKYQYIQIKNRKIILEFIDVMSNSTFIPDRRFGQFNMQGIVTLNKKIPYSFRIQFEPFKDTIDKDFVEITFYTESYFDISKVYEAYGESNNSITGFCLRNYGFGDDCIEFRNRKLYYFLKKYVLKSKNEQSNISDVFIDTKMKIEKK